jgi:hypothetical protein
VTLQHIHTRVANCLVAVVGVINTQPISRGFSMGDGFFLSTIGAGLFFSSKLFTIGEQGREDHALPILIRERKLPDDKE